MMPRVKTLIHNVRSVFFGSLRAGLLTSLFVLSLLFLLAFLWYEVRQAHRIVMPFGQNDTVNPEPLTRPSSDPQPVLILNSYHMGYTWSDNEMAGITETFRKAGVKIEPLIEFLDCKHFPKMEHFGRLRDLFHQKYGTRNFPVVIAADNPALEFALTYRRRLFPDATVVFCGINGFTNDMIRGQENVTGVAETLDAGGTMSAALKIHPGTREVIVIHDYTVTGLATRRTANEQLKTFSGRVAFRYLDDMTVTELMRYVKRLPSDEIVLALSYGLDKGGQVMNHETIARLLSTNSPVPVYSVHEERLGYGIVGGSLLGGKPQGVRAAEMAIRVLAGESASHIPVDLKSAARLMFDYNQLVRFHIPLKALPQGSLVVNQPVSFFVQYRGLAITTVAVMIVLTAGIMFLGYNIYQRRMAEEEQKKLQTQLMQAHKMEAVGHLAGGVAHDFNNILTAIIGYASLLLKKMPAGDISASSVEQILASAHRAAALVKSLLAFSRKQVIDPRPVRLNDIVLGIEKLSRRLIGEDIEFKIVLRDGDVTVMADSGQIEQVLMNLCTNARDAMPDGGRLTIETAAVIADEKFRKTHLVERPGRYGVIAVSDTGCGMDENTKKQIFEPFFTTKEVGKGTGLGLSIAYGIIKQHQGTINVYSEPGRGTTFKIYLPLTAGESERLSTKEEMQPRGGGETILLAEDEAEIRTLMKAVLHGAGYTVIEAADGEEAVKKFALHKDSIQFLLADMIMPKKNGKEVYREIRAIKPGLKVLFVSGYTADLIHHHGFVDNGTQFISKPISPDQLLRKVRDVLDS